MMIDQNVWLDKAINQLYLMREEHNALMKEFILLKQRVGASENRIEHLIDKMVELQEALKDQVIIL